MVKPSSSPLEPFNVGDFMPIQTKAVLVSAVHSRGEGSLPPSRQQNKGPKNAALNTMTQSVERLRP